MDVEAFTMAKDPADAARNEDRYVVIPGRAYAVIDGSSDKIGLRHNGQTGGQAAALAVEEVIRDLCEEERPETIDADGLAARLEKRFRALHEEIKAAQEPMAPQPMWCGAQLVLALEGRTTFRFIVIGDSGIRLNGCDTFSFHQPLDDICSSIRKAVWALLTERGASDPDRNDIARAYTVGGLASLLPEGTPWIGEDDLDGLRQRAIDEATRLQKSLDPKILRKAVFGGLREQYLYVNRIHPLGAPSINGFPIPRQFIMQLDRSAGDIQTIELFSDGYFGYPDGIGISDWESHFARVESEDPAKVGKHASTKGSYNGRYADDRTVLILRREPQALQRSLS